MTAGPAVHWPASGHVVLPPDCFFLHFLHEPKVLVQEKGWNIACLADGEDRMSGWMGSLLLSNGES